MIELGDIRLEHRTAVYDARNKVRGLAYALGYGDIEVTRLAIAVSEAARKLGRNTHAPRIAVALDEKSSPPQLVLDFECRAEPPDLTAHRLLNDTRLPLDWDEQRVALGLS